MMKFPIYGKIKNMFQSTNQKCTLTACQHVRTCPEAKELMRFQVDSHEKQQKNGLIQISQTTLEAGL